MRKFTPMSRKV